MSLYHSNVGCLSNICSKYADEQNRKKNPKFSKIVFDSSLLAFRGIHNLKHIRSFRRKWTLKCVPQAWGTFYGRVCVCEFDRFGAGSVMVCAGICHDGHTQLKIVEGILNVY